MSWDNEVVNGLPESTVTPRSTALMIVDMQYEDAHRDYGLGARAKRRGADGDGGFDSYFTRLETTTVPNIRRLIDACRANGIPVTHVRMMNLAGDSSDTSWRYKANRVFLPPGTKEAEFLEELAPEPGEVIFNKTTSSVFVSSNADFALRNMGIDTLIMTGVATNNCVESATRGAADLGYRVLLVEDACAALTEEGHKYATSHLDRNYAIVKSTDQVLQEIEAAAALREDEVPAGAA